MDDMVYNALRRKLAAAKAIGDLDRINRIRAMMPASEKVASEVPAVAPPAWSAEVIHIVAPLASVDAPETLNPDVGSAVDAEE